MERPQITIRYGASSDDISVDGHTFVRHKLDYAGRRLLREGVVDGLIKTDALRANRKWRKRRRGKAVAA